jgi:hypothetical protein
VSATLQVIQCLHTLGYSVSATLQVIQCLLTPGSGVYLFSGSFWREEHVQRCDYVLGSFADQLLARAPILTPPIPCSKHSSNAGRGLLLVAPGNTLNQISGVNFSSALGTFSGIPVIRAKLCACPTLACGRDRNDEFACAERVLAQMSERDV